MRCRDAVVIALGVVLGGSAQSVSLVSAQEPSPATQQPPPPDPAPEPEAEPGTEPAPVGEDSLAPTARAPALSLPQAVEIALQSNFGLLSAGDSLQASQLREAVARAQFYPKLTPSYQRSADDSTFSVDASQRLPWSGASLTANGSLRSNPGGEVAPARFSDVRVTLTQPLLRGFGPNSTYYDLTNSRRGREAQERSYELSRQRLAIQVTSAFYQVIQQRALLAVARQSLQRSQDLLRASDARLKVGLASKLDVYRAELQASQAQEAMVRSQAALETALEQFRALLGRPPTDPVEPEAVELAGELQAEADPLPVLVAQALRHRLDLQENRDQVGDARRSASLARQSLLPQLDLNVSLAQSGFGSSYGDAFRFADSRWSVFFSTSYPLERSADRAGHAVARIELEARHRSLRQRELEVEGEVRGAVRELERIRKSVELQRKGVEIAEQQQRLATLRYQRGLASNFDVVDAEGSLVLARSALVGLLTSYQVARVELLRATGTLDLSREFAP